MVVDDDDDAFLEDERQIELSSIAAIFPELVIDSKNPYLASIELPVSPSPPVSIVFPQLTDGAAPSVALPTPPDSDGSTEEGKVAEENRAPIEETPQDIHQLSHLPPLSLQIELIEGYPSINPPRCKLSAVSLWVPEQTLLDLAADCKTLWEELGRDQVIFAFIDHLQQAAERGFDLVDTKNGSALEVSQDMKISLLDFDRKTKQEKFDQETFSCGICLDPKKGSSCHRLQLCGHVFCVECLQDFYNNCITEGDIMSVRCLDPGCGRTQLAPAEGAERPTKEDRTIQPSELLQISISQEQVKRFVKLKRKTELESDKNTIYCPRKWCQGAARTSMSSPLPSATSSEDLGAPSDKRLAICEDCSYAFCRICGLGWHGELKYCHPRNPSELSAEEKASEEYLQRHSSPCPTCDAPCQKSEGCNHMICFRCSTHFCYLCSAWLSSSNPYEHFNKEWGSCYMRLWELEGGDGDDVETRPQQNARPHPAGAGADADAGAGAGPIPLINHQDDFDDNDDNHINEHEILQFVLAAMPEAPAPPAAAAPPAAVARAIAQPGPGRRQQQQQQQQQRRRGGGRGRNNQHEQRDPAPQDRGAGQVGRARGRAQQQQAPQRGNQHGAGRRGRGPNPQPPPQPQRPPLENNDQQGHGGIRRFLEMVERDEEDEWDSDELSEEGDEWDRFR